MKRKTALIILITVIIAALLIVFGFIFYSNNFDETNNNIVITPPGDSIAFPLDDTERDTSGDVDIDDPNSDLNFGQTDPDIPQLRQIYDKPISGFTTFDRIVDVDTKEVYVPESVYRFVDRATGHIYESTSISLANNRLTNTTIPKVRESFFFNEGEGVVLRYIDSDSTIATYVAQITESTSTSTSDTSDRLTGQFIEKDIIHMVKDSDLDSNAFFYTDFEGNGYTFNGNTPQRKQLVMESSIFEWALDWSGPNVLLSVIPTYLDDGVIMELNTSNGLFTKLIDDKKGLFGKANSDGSKILYSSNVNGDPKLFIYDQRTRETKGLTVNSFADKCVWSKKDMDVLYCAVAENLNSGNYPDDWYKGLVSFNDNIYEIDLKNDTVKEIDGIDRGLDIVNPKLTENEDFIVFQNKKDLTLWSLEIGN